jgi:hypothetical protein
MLTVVLLSVTNKSFMVHVIMLTRFMLIVLKLTVVMLSVVIQSVVAPL